MKRHRFADRLAWAIAVANLAVFGIFVLVGTANDPGDPIISILLTVMVAELAFIGAVLVARVPGNPIGPWLLAAGTTLSVGIMATAVATTLSGWTTPPAIAAWAALAGNVLYFYPVVIVLIVIPLLFPNGRLPSRRWRWIVVMTAVGVGEFTIGGMLRPGPVGDTGFDNPLGSPALSGLIEWLDLVAVAIVLPAFVAAPLSVIVRYRRAAGVERQQLKWLMAAAAVASSALSAAILLTSDSALGQSLFDIGFFGLIALPLAIGVAILRYHLYEIDRIISRSIGWAVVTGALVAVYLVAVLVLQWALGSLTNGNTIAVAVSTLVAAATFQPIRLGTQRAVDRRFDRARFDGERTATAFAERLRSEAAIDSVAADLQTTVGVALRPAWQGLWLRRAPE